jgi:hypothetical protein
MKDYGLRPRVAVPHSKDKPPLPAEIQCHDCMRGVPGGPPELGLRRLTRIGFKSSRDQAILWIRCRDEATAAATTLSSQVISANAAGTVGAGAQV